MTRIFGSRGCAARARAQQQVRDRRDRRQRLAAKAEGLDRRQIVRGPDLARRVALERQPRVVGLHPLAVVFDANQPLAAELGRDGDATGAGVEAVFDELLDDGRGALDHLARGDLVCQSRHRQPMDSHDIRATRACGGTSTA